MIEQELIIELKNELIVPSAESFFLYFVRKNKEIEQEKETQ